MEGVIGKVKNWVAEALNGNPSQEGVSQTVEESPCDAAQKPKSAPKLVCLPGGRKKPAPYSIHAPGNERSFFRKQAATKPLSREGTD